MSQVNSQSSMASMVESAINKEQKEKLTAILKHVSKLSDLEKLYLYLKLPTGQAVEEPVKKTCPSPLASSNRTSITLTWIKSHYIEDRNVCVPKQEVYNQYRLYCEAININPVGSADFGKMVKTAFPNIHHRRLGQRGKSKYCYGGLTRKMQIEIPNLPVIQTKQSEKTVAAPNPLQEMQHLSSQLVCEWTCLLFDKKFTDLKSVAQYLVQTGASYGKKAALFSMLYDNNGTQSRFQDTKSSDSKLQDTQALLQRKLLQKEVLKGHLNLLKQLQKSQREVKSSPISTSETPVGHHDTKCLPKCAGNVVSDDQSRIAIKLLSRNRSVSANLVESYEREVHTITKSTSTSNRNNSATVASQGYVNRDASIYVNAYDKYAQNGLVGSELISHKMDKQLVDQPSREPSVSMSISNDSLLSEQGPEVIHAGENHKHQKRLGDVLSGSLYDRVRKRRRCMTSLGVPHQESTEDLANKNNTTASEVELRIRPFSCPTLCDILSLGPCMKSKEMVALKKKPALNYWKEKGSHKGKEKHRTFTIEELNQKKSFHSCKSMYKESEQNDTKSDKSSFHFVQKPTVIAVRQPGRVFPSVMSCPNFSTSQKFEKDSQDSSSDVKKTCNILNTLLSSDADLLPKPILANQTTISSSLPLSMQHQDDLDNCINQPGKKLPHTLDNAYILSSQSNRSAFVPVASNKLQDYSRSRSSHPCLNMHSPSIERQKSDSKPLSHVSQSERHNEPLSSDEGSSTRINLQHGSQDSCVSAVLSNSSLSESNSLPYSVSIGNLVDASVSDCFRPITYSTSHSAMAVTSITHQLSVTPTPLISSSPVSQTNTSTQKSHSNACNTMPTTKPSNKTGMKSPVTPPKRQSRSRFTPIRPKLSGCNSSLQKKDVRPVSMIFEQRVCNAQELLVNIANTYQGEVKLQMPAELLGLSPSGQAKSSDVLVTIGTPGAVSSSSVLSLPAVSQNKEIKVALEPQSQSTFDTTTSVSSSSSQVSHVNAEDTGLSLLSDDEQFQGNIPKSKTGAIVPINDACKTVLDKPTLNAQKVLVSSISNTASAPLTENNGQDKKLVIVDSNGTIYSLDKDSQPFPFSEKVPNQHQTDSSNVSGVNSSSMEMPSVINVADINGQVIGPDDTGQTYLIIPNSQSSLEAQENTRTTSVISGTSSFMPSTSKESQFGIQTLSSMSGVSSSSALLSELSQLASASRQEKAQTLIQHDSALSAFHKCAPNKPQSVTTSIPQGSNLYSEEGSLMSSDCLSENRHSIKLINLPLSKRHRHNTTDADSINQMCDALNSFKDSDISQGHLVRKRKASKSREEGVKDKKRQNTSESSRKLNEDDDDVLIVDEEKESSNTDEIIPGHPFSKSMHQVESTSVNEKSLSVQEKPEIDFSDTDSLLEMIAGSRSLTVKQTIMVMNSLRAEMRKKLQDSSPHLSSSDIDSESQTQQLKSVVETSKEVKNIEESPKPDDQSNDTNKRNIVKSVTDLSTDWGLYVHNHTLRERRNMSKDIKGRLTPKITRSNRRNMSLNLESLESDALLDSELTLDHYLMCDVGESKTSKPDSKTSVAVAAKTSHSTSIHKQEENCKKTPDSRSNYPITTENVSSLHTILNEKRVGNMKRDKESNTSQKELTQTQTSKLTERPGQLGKLSCTTSTGALTLPRRSVSCVRDILQRSASSFLDPLKQDKLNSVEKSYGADYFDALLSKLQSKSSETIISDSRTKLQPQNKSDLDIPLDVVDFVTESMSSGSMFNYPSARCLSVPNTKPDFFNLKDSFNMTLLQRPPSSEVSDAGSIMLSESNIFLYDQKQTDSVPDKVDDLLGGQSDEKSSNNKQNVFLSPVGPAKLARRLSIEKSLAQPLIDRSIMKTPVEFLSSRHGSESSPIKSSSGMKAQTTDRQKARTPVDRTMNYVERKRAKTPFDPAMNNQFIEKKNEKQVLVSQTSEDVSSSKPPVNRSLTQTPLDKFFHKIVSDSLLSKYQVENFNQHCFRDQSSSQDDHSSSQTPTSDAGYGSVSETPVSDFGYNSISPSPVMMSSSSFFGECGRRDITSPATIFMPLRSDSALSLSNNITSDHLVCPPQTNLTEILPSVSNQFGDSCLDGFDQNDKNGPDSLPFTQTIRSSPLSSSSQAVQIPLETSPENKEGKSESNNSEMTDFLDLSKLVSLNSIPTPPFSPNSALMSTAPTTFSPLPFSIRFSPLPNHDNSPSPPAMPRFLLPCSTSVSSSSILQPHHQSSASPPRHFFPQDQQSPCISHVLTPSPHILARPPSSPHHFGTHPSPPFTPSSQRSLPSPCPTPSSFKSVISPRSLTPSIDSSQVPNAFMPIQSSCVRTASLAPTHTYIQPIKPVVTLASPSSHVAGNETQAHASDSNMGILSSFMDTSQKNRRHTQGRSTPAASEKAETSSHKFFGGITSKVTGLVTDDMNSFSSENYDIMFSENQTSSSQNDQQQTNLDSKHGDTSFHGNTSFQHLKYAQPCNIKAPRDSLHASPKSLLSSHDQHFDTVSGNDDENALQLFQPHNLQSKGYHSTLTKNYSSSLHLDNLTISRKETLHLSPSSTQTLSQTDSPFSAVPSKLQVDLTKLENSQNPSRMVHSKPFHSRQCKVNLDICHTSSSSVQESLATQGRYSSTTSFSLTNPASLTFDSRKDKGQNASFKNLTHLDPSSVNNQTHKTLWNESLSKPSCQDDLQTTLEVLRDMDSQYFPCDDDSSNSGSASGS